MTKSSIAPDPERLTDSLATSGLALWEWWPQSNKVSVSPGWKSLIGLGPDELQDPWAGWKARLHPDDQGWVLADVERMRRGEAASISGEYRLRRRTGEYRWILCHASIVKQGTTGGPERVVGTLLDVTRLKETELSLREQRTLLQSVLSASPTPIFVKDAEGRFLLVNEALATDYGLPVDELVNRSNAEVHRVAEEAAGFAAADREVLATGATVSVEERFTRPRGDVAWFRTVKTPLRRADGSVAVLGLSTDITQYRRALEEIGRLNEKLEARDAARTAELKRSISLLGAAIDSTADGILVVDRDTKVVFFNRQFLSLWRIPESIAATRDDGRLLDFVVDQLREPEMFLSRVRALYDDPEAVSFDVLEFKDGRVFERYSQPQRLEGTVVGRVWSFRDITERRRAEEAAREHEEQLRQSQKMEAVGRLAGGIAHDFNNLLTGILGYSNLLLEDPAVSGAVQSDIKQVCKAADRAAALTGQLLAFSRKQVMQPKVLDLNGVVKNLGTLLERVIGEDVELVTQLDPAIPPILADPSQIEQVVLNLAVNAREALPNGGRVRLATKAGRRRLADGAEETVAVLVVSDNGEGMTGDVRARVFEPYFTTKSGGTGLGLSMAYGIVKQSGGDIAVTSAPGTGSTFTIYLPAAEGIPEATPTEAAATTPDRGSETILLVEDEDQVRSLASRVLRDKGYRVLEASCPRDALALSDNHPDGIDLLLSDVVLPELSGPALADRLLAKRPSLKVLFISGYAATALGADIFPVGEHFLAKPFTPADLTARLRDVLNG